MSSAGAVKVINVQNKPQLISLSTAQGILSGSEHNDVTWVMQDSISVSDQNFTAVVHLHSMVFFNSFANITNKKNTLKILSTYLDNGTQKEDIINITIPTGHYDISSLLAYLNTDGVCNSNDGTYYYGLGVYGDSENYPPFKVSSSDPLKLTFSPPTAGTTGVLDAAADVHTYTGFYFIVDEDTIPAMNVLGMLQQAQSGVFTNTVTVAVGSVNYSCVGFSVFNGGTGTDYSFANPWVAPTDLETTAKDSVNSIRLNGPNAIAVSWEQIYANTRTSFNGLSKGDTVAIVPVIAAYGYKNAYQPPNPFKIVIPNFNINRFRLVIKDAGTGDAVDFQGTDWIVNLSIDFFEIENNYKSEKALEGVGRNVFPTLHQTVHDHNLPFSGTGGHINRNKHGTDYGKRQRSST